MADYEVELKFRLAGNRGAILSRLVEWGAKSAGESVQIDTYFAHPSRDFAATDEAFRIRQQDETNFLTYKGPLLDRQTKTRQEIEIGFAAGPQPFGQMRAMLQALGFRAVASVSKTRRSWSLVWEGRDFEIAFDDVAGLGEYVELEILSGEAEWQAARDSAVRLAETLGLQDSERRSYLKLLFAAGHPACLQFPQSPEVT
jgi:adenylate cyclase class 2